MPLDLRLLVTKRNPLRSQRTSHHKKHAHRIGWMLQHDDLGPVLLHPALVSSPLPSMVRSEGRLEVMDEHEFTEVAPVCVHPVQTLS